MKRFKRVTLLIIGIVLLLLIYLDMKGTPYFSMEGVGNGKLSLVLSQALTALIKNVSLKYK